MGANAEVLRAAYQTHVVYQRPAIPTPELPDVKDAPTKLIINESNWKDFLGDERFVVSSY